MRITTLTIVAVLAATPLAAQAPPDGSANRAAIGKLNFMIGVWKGDAWMQQGPGARENASMTETVEAQLDGVVLLIHGRGTSLAIGEYDRVVHNAFAVLAWDAQAQKYVMRSWLANGFWGDFPVEVIEGGVSWSRDVPGGRVRYIARIDDREWHEIGEFTRDSGTTWTRIMEMRLLKQP